MFISGIEVIIERKLIKHTYLRIDANGAVHVSAPYRRSEAEIKSFVISRLDWIKERQLKLYEHSNVQSYKYNEGEFIKLALEYTQYWGVKLGVTVENISFRDMKTRWGSCTPKTQRIRLNTRLEHYPPECLEYIVLHELAHIIEPQHDAKFYAILEFNMPDWKQRKLKLS